MAPGLPEGQLVALRGHSGLRAVVACLRAVFTLPLLIPGRGLPLHCAGSSERGSSGARICRRRHTLTRCAPLESLFLICATFNSRGACSFASSRPSEAAPSGHRVGSSSVGGSSWLRTCQRYTALTIGVSDSDRYSSPSSVRIDGGNVTFAA